MCLRKWKMKILTYDQFMQTPKETVFSYYEPTVFRGLFIKTSDKYSFKSDILFDDMICCVDSDESGEFFDKCLAMEKGGSSEPLNFEITEREGLHNKEQLYAVYEEQDVKDLIKRLQKTLEVEDE